MYVELVAAILASDRAKEVGIPVHRVRRDLARNGNDARVALIKGCCAIADVAD